MSSSSNRLFLFSLATSLYHAARMFCSSISQFYLYSLGFNTAKLFKLYAFHSIMISLMNLPVSVYADRFSKKNVVFLGLGCVCINYFSLWALAPLSRTSSWKELCLYIIYFSEIIYALGREMINSALDAWFVSELSDEEREIGFPQYTHMTQTYTPILSLISALVGIGLSYWSEFSSCYLLSFCCLLAVAGLFFSIAKQPSAQPASSLLQAKPTSPNISSVKMDSSFSKIFMPYWKIIASASGAIATVSLVMVYFSRWITFHFWQSTFLGKVDKGSAHLPHSFFIPLIAYTIAMYVGQYLSNRFLKSERAFSQKYFNKGALLILLGSGCAALIGLKPYWNLHCNKQVCLALTALYFAALQGTISASQSLNNNLFIRQTNPAYLAGALGILHLFGRALTSLASWSISNNAVLKGEILFLIPAISLFVFFWCLIVWVKYLPTFLKKSDPITAASPQNSAPLNDNK